MKDGYLLVYEDVQHYHNTFQDAKNELESYEKKMREDKRLEKDEKVEFVIYELHIADMYTY